MAWQKEPPLLLLSSEFFITYNVILMQFLYHRLRYLALHVSWNFDDYLGWTGSKTRHIKIKERWYSQVVKIRYTSETVWRPQYSPRPRPWGHSLYDGQGVYCGLSTASEVYLIFTTWLYQRFRAFFLFMLFSDEPEVFLPKYTKPAILALPEGSKPPLPEGTKPPYTFCQMFRMKKWFFKE